MNSKKRNYLFSKILLIINGVLICGVLSSIALLGFLFLKTRDFHGPDWLHSRVSSSLIKMNSSENPQNQIEIKAEKVTKKIDKTFESKNSEVYQMGLPQFNKESSDNFLAEEDIKVLLNQVENQLDSDQAELNFKSIDTEANYRHSIHSLNIDYPADANWKNDFRKISYQKVIALHFLIKTKQLNFKTCQALILEQLERYHKGTVQQQWALNWDLLALGKICAQKDKIAYQQLLKQYSHGQPKAQLELALFRDVGN